MAFPSKRPSWCAGMILAAMSAFACAGAVLAADGPHKEIPVRLEAPAVARLIDKAIKELQAANKTTPAARADDAEFLRRAYLDITGVIPPSDKVVAFLDSKQADKRARLIDEL